MLRFTTRSDGSGSAPLSSRLPFVRTVSTRIHSCTGSILRDFPAVFPVFGLFLAVSTSLPPLAWGAEDTPGETQYVLVEGQVTDQMGTGLSLVEIVARPMAKPGETTEPLGSTTTDVLGDFLLSASKPYKGKIVLTFTKPMFASLTREVEVGGEDLPYLGESLRGDLTIGGRVIHALTEAPIAGATVTASTFDQSWTGTSGEDGRFELKGVTPGSGEIAVSAKGFGRTREVIRRFLDVGELELRLKPERKVHIKVVDETGKPVSGVVVESFDRDRDHTRSVATDEQGAVVVDAVHADTKSLSLRLSHEDYVSDTDFSRTVLLPPDKTESTHRQTVARAGRIVGRVTSGDGQPVHSARVMTGDTYVENSPRDWTSHRGTFTVVGVRPGPVTVTVHAPGHAPVLETVTVEAGERTAVDVKLSKGATVRGRVEDANGDPVEGIHVNTGQWRERNTLGLQAVSDASGTFHFDDAPLDRFEVTAAPRIGDPITQSVQGSSDRSVTFVFPVEPVRSGPIGTEGLAVGDVAPEVVITTMDGTEIKTGDLKGKVILLDFWATWCAPCLDEMPYLIAVWNKYRERDDFVMVGLSRDFDAPVLKDFLRRSDAISWAQAVGAEGGVEQAARRFGVTWIPRVYLVDRAGKVVGKDLRGEDVMRELDKLFAK